MSATATEKRKSPAKRVEILSRELDRRQVKLAAAEAEIEQLESGQQAAVDEALRADPTKSAFGPGSPASERKRKAVELGKTAVNLRSEILSLRAQLDAASAEQAADELTEATKEAKRLGRRELELRARFGQAFAELAEISNDLMATFAARDLLTANGAQVATRVGFFDRAAVAAWEAAVVPAVEPVPQTFAELIEETLRVSTGERPDVEAEYRAVDELNARRRAMAERDPGGADDLPLIPRPVIQANPLHELVPDLRQIVRTAEGGPMGEPDPTQAEGQEEDLAASGFGAGPVSYAADGQAIPSTAA